MSYKVIHYFTDLQDFNHAYKVGDVFPRLGLKVTEERLKELSGNKNKQKKPLIAWENDEKSVEKVVTKEEKAGFQLFTKTDINRMSIADLKELASGNGVDNVEDYTGAELKKILIEKLGL